MAANNDIAAAAPDERVLIIERIFDAPRELVFRCWTEPELFAQWTGPKGFTSTTLAWDAREGGHYRIHKRGPDGQDHWQQGVFREVVPPERIVRTYCWADADGRPIRPETLLTVTFEAVGPQTRIVLHQVTFESVTSRDEHGRGWRTSMDQLAEYLTTQGISKEM